MKKEELIRLCESYHDRLVEHRRTLHRHPEVAFEEAETEKYIEAVLERCGIPYDTIEGYHAVIGRLSSGRPGKTIAFRSDIDALRIQEETGCDFASENPGKMHACGHDGHMAILLTFAELLSAHKELFDGDVVFIFQHAEELPPGGAKLICEQGFLKNVDAIYGGHIWPGYQAGQVCIRSGEVMAAGDEFHITLTGRGGHGSEPQNTRDVTLAASAIIMEIQQIVSRNVNPRDIAVVSIGSIHTGSAFNVIPERLEMSGTLRAFNEETHQYAVRRLCEIADGVAKLHGVECEMNYIFGYPAVINDRAAAEGARRAVSALTDLDVIEGQAAMASEDFSYYQAEVPGAYFHFGSANDAKNIHAVLHTPNYCMDEDVLENALQVYLACLVG